MSGLPAITVLCSVLLQIARVCCGVLVLMLCQDHVNAEEVPCDGQERSFCPLLLSGCCCYQLFRRFFSVWCQLFSAALP